MFLSCRNSGFSRASGLLAIGVIALVASAKESFKVTGFAGRSSTEAASGVTVQLKDAESGTVVGSVRTGFTGRYKFENLKPGRYLLEAGDWKREIVVHSKDLRLDIDLSSRDGTLNYVNAQDLQALSAAATSGAAPAGPTDPQLMRELAGQYWGYSGSTEVNLALCPGGQFMEQSESSYSGTMRDGAGNQTGAWGTANQSGKRGKWSVQGNTSQGTIRLSYSSGNQTNMAYRLVDQGCYSFNGRTLCRKGPAPCQ